MQSFVSTGWVKKNWHLCYSFEYQMYQFFFTHPVYARQKRFQVNDKRIKNGNIKWENQNMTSLSPWVSGLVYFIVKKKEACRDRKDFVELLLYCMYTVCRLTIQYRLFGGGGQLSHLNFQTKPALHVSFIVYTHCTQDWLFLDFLGHNFRRLFFKRFGIYTDGRFTLFLD
jgi:hypothetical protein